MIHIQWKPTGVWVDGHSEKQYEDHADVCCTVTATVHNFVVAFSSLSDKPLKVEGDVSEGGGTVHLDWGNAPDAYGNILIEALYLQLAKISKDCKNHIIFDD